MNLTEKKIELANALTHGIPAIFFLAASPLLVIFPLLKRDNIMAYANILFVFGLLMTYLSSTIYHAITDADFKQRVRILDHSSIFLMIGGSFTSIGVAYRGNSDIWTFLAVFWAINLAGIVYKIFFTGKHKFVSTLFYVALAWLGAMFLFPAFQNMPTHVFYLIVAGGLSYTIGTAFYMWKSLTYHHAIWHVFVFGGSITHFLAIAIAS